MDERTGRNSSINKRVLAVIILIVLIFVASLIAIWVINGRSDSEKYVRIYHDGELLEEYPLDEDGTYRIEAVDGEYNIVEIKDGYVCVTEANCANQTCVQTGKINTGATPIVCLPHKLVIRIEGEEPEVDAVAD